MVHDFRCSFCEVGVFCILVRNLTHRLGQNWVPRGAITWGVTSEVLDLILLHLCCSVHHIYGVCGKPQCQGTSLIQQGLIKQFNALCYLVY